MNSGLKNAERTLVIIEENPLWMRILSSLAENLGFEVVEAQNEKAALELLGISRENELEISAILTQHPLCDEVHTFGIPVVQGPDISCLREELRQSLSKILL